MIADTALHDTAVTYPYSLVPGGVNSDADIPRTGRLGEQYAGFGFMHRTYLQADRSTYVEFQREGQFLWARLTLHRGEMVLTDRYDHVARGRCGNVVTDVLPKNAKVFLPPNEAVEHSDVRWIDSPAIPSALQAGTGIELAAIEAQAPEEFLPLPPPAAVMTGRPSYPALTGVPAILPFLPTPVGRVSTPSPVPARAAPEPRTFGIVSLMLLAWMCWPDLERRGKQGID